MSQQPEEFTNLGFIQTYVWPTLLIFLLPVLNLIFFEYAEARFDHEIREAYLADINSNGELNRQEKQDAIAFMESVNISDIVMLPEYQGIVHEDTEFYYANFRWMIRASWFSIGAGIGVYLLAGFCVFLANSSQQGQYYGLLTCWHTMRLNSALQTILQGLMIFALSFWVTALLFDIYIIRIIIIAGIIALIMVGIVLKGIFERINTDFVVSGKVVTPQDSMPLWEELRLICQKVGTDPPDQVILGIDDNFFVTQQPITVNDKVYKGRTLFVSLSMLKQLDGREADAVLAHEMAHFSGQDTLYSMKIAPLLNRYDLYLGRLYEGGLTLPVFYYMVCIRALFELILSKSSRDREFRADRIAVETTSPESLAGALLRIVAYTKYRMQIEDELFDIEEVLDEAKVLDQIESGFRDFAFEFSEKNDLSELSISHPFDTHPPLSQRFEACGIQFNQTSSHQFLCVTGDGRWFDFINAADDFEREQWDEYEKQFRQYHEETLAYRFLPDDQRERDLVEKVFPPVKFEGKKYKLEMDCEKMFYSKWSEPIYFRNVKNMSMDDSTLSIYFEKSILSDGKINLNSLGDPLTEVLGQIERYYGRYLAAIEYQKFKAERKNQKEVSNELT